MTKALTGWKFPIEIDPQTGKFKTVSGDEDIKEAIRIILTTKKRERIGNPQFGSNVFNFMFANINTTELSELEFEITEELNRWEPRIKDLEVEAQMDPNHKGRVYVSIRYETDNSLSPEEVDLKLEVNEGINF